MPPPCARTGALCDELELAGIPVRRQVGSPAIYQGKPLPLGFRADSLADETAILEIKAVPALPRYARGHGVAARRAKTQLQTYPRRSGLPVGLLLKFLALRLKDGLMGFVG